ncbi:MAG: cysteine desulfurase [Armatimonadetes bacterium]|nr:cysteine desulfurase [Armatimonadota bacterium]
MRRIYLDHAASSPLLPSAKAAMEHALALYGNPSSLHAEGRAAKARIDEAREVVAASLGCLFAEVIFTSGGTESANMAILGASVAALGGARNRIIFSSIEHPCVLETTETLQKLGYKVETIPCSRAGFIEQEALANMVDKGVLLVAVMHANNEVGTIQPVRQLSEIAHKAGALLYCDAVQTYRTIPFTASDLDADLISITGHKIGGPRGAGALYIRAGVKIAPLISGGGQEREMRGGTEDVAAIAGFAAAVQDETKDQRKPARDAFLAKLRGSRFVETVSHDHNILPGHAHLRLPGTGAETLLIRLDRAGIAASSGSACSSGSLEPSHVLQAMGYSAEECREGLRFTFGRTSTVEEAEAAADILLNLATS